MLPSEGEHLTGIENVIGPVESELSTAVQQEEPVVSEPTTNEAILGGFITQVKDGKTE